MRLQQLESKNYTWLASADKCFHYGEYTSEGGFGASDTNRWITNLKKKPTASANELYYKRQAFIHWGSILAGVIPPKNSESIVTFVPMPGSKPKGHSDYDDRMLQVLRSMANGFPNLDVRPLLVQKTERAPQHHGNRLSPGQLASTLELDATLLSKPLKAIIFVVDDVITMGASFAAAKQKLSAIPHADIRGLFLAKTVWPNPFGDE